MTSGVVSKDMVKEFKQFWQSHKSNSLNGRNFILSSICPQVFGLYVVKLAVALVLAGGVQKKSGSSRIRGDSHLLLVGDPGTAKSQFLKFATKVSPRSVLTSGIGTTNAGLTVSAVKESGRWELEAGALVLADGGICCIDEFSCIKEQDKTCIHEAMEQQTISVAKAGLVCSLNTRCSILAATNPKSKYDESMSLSENTALGTPLLSRFDIILVLLDTYDENWDNMVASYILDGRNISTDKSSALWSASKMKSYFILIRHINPKMTPQAERILRSYYTKQRSFQSRSTSRTTPRLLQSLIRLAEGHARLMLRNEVLIMDAVIAIILVDSTMLDGSILEGLSPLHTIFPEDPVSEYIEKAEKVFRNLNVEINIEENYEYFYEEIHLKNLFHEISAIWTSEDIPYLFGNSCDESSNNNLFQDNGLAANETTTNSDHPDESEDLFHKPAQVSNFFQNSLPAQQTNLPETHADIVVPVAQPHELRNEISTLSDLRNIFGDGISETKVTNSKSVSNASVLNQILDAQNGDRCTSREFFQINIDKSQRKNIINPDNNEEFNSSDKKEYSSENRTSRNISSSLSFERSDTDILQELGIIQEDKSEDLKTDQHTNSTQISTIQETEPEKMQSSPFIFEECSQSSSDKSTIVNKIFPFKRSLSEHLKSFAFSKSHINSHQNLKCNKTANLEENYNKAGPSSILKADDNIEKLKSNNRNSQTGSQSINKKSAFKMIVDRSKSSQSKIMEKKDENYSSTSEISLKSQNIDVVNQTKNDKTLDEITKNKNELANITKNQSSPNVGNNNSKKQTPDHLKKFLFSKKSKTSDANLDKK